MARAIVVLLSGIVIAGVDRDTRPCRTSPALHFRAVAAGRRSRRRRRYGQRDRQPDACGAPADPRFSVALRAASGQRLTHPMQSGQGSPTGAGADPVPARRDLCIHRPGMRRLDGHRGDRPAVPGARPALGAAATIARERPSRCRPFTCRTPCRSPVRAKLVRLTGTTEEGGE